MLSSIGTCALNVKISMSYRCFSPRRIIAHYYWSTEMKRLIILFILFKLLHWFIWGLKILIDANRAEKKKWAQKTVRAHNLWVHFTRCFFHVWCRYSPVNQSIIKNEAIYRLTYYHDTRIIVNFFLFRIRFLLV